MRKTYQNPIAVKGDFADPFVLRHNGRYYLYCTNPDIRCWSSADLVDWELEGPAIDAKEFPELVPFAPEVTYSNGKFYLYTSPSGFGHYVLASDSPTGPFKKISDNIHHAIDGSVFIDDDGKWYFYWAGEEGIWGCEMKSPTQPGEPVLTGVTMNGWTEGPFIYKRRGIYYMTYTGNHYLSRGYRINAAWSKHPLTGYLEDAYNPLIVHTQGEVVGLGHSSTVLGPDLVSHYIVYHNMNEDLSRDLDIDRQLWSDHVTQIIGPTRTCQPGPSMPDYSFPSYGATELQWHFPEGNWTCGNHVYYSRAERFLALTKNQFSCGFTAEFHIILPESNFLGQTGIIVGKSDTVDYRLTFDQEAYRVQLWDRMGEDAKPMQEAKLPEDYQFDTLHCIRMECNKDSKVFIFIDNRLQMEMEHLEFTTISLGYFSQGQGIGCGYTAVTKSTQEEAAKTAVLAPDCPFYPVFGSGTYQAMKNGSIRLAKDQTAEYRLLIPKDAKYSLYLTNQVSESRSEAELFVDRIKIGTWNGKEGMTVYHISLSAGEHSLEIDGSLGEMVINKISLVSADEDFYYDGPEPTDLTGPYGKILSGKSTWHNYKVSAIIKPEFMDQESKAGILLRVTEPSEGGEGADKKLGLDFFKGYSVSISEKSIEITRHSYNRQILACAPFEYHKGQSCELHADICDDMIRVWVAAEQEPRLIVRDPVPFTHGCSGIWAQNSLIYTEKLSIHESKE